MNELKLRDYQAGGIQGLREGFAAGHRAQILYAPTGGGKCLGFDTPVLMFDGSIRMVQSVRVGDTLIGPDGMPRRVLSLARGRENLYRVEQEIGDAYVVNESHILSLRNDRGLVKNIPVRGYMAEPRHWQIRNPGWRVPGILRGDLSPELTHITVEPIGEGDYFGFEIDGDHLFLLGDFTVTHNTELAISMLNAASQKLSRSAMILDRIVLCDQTSTRLDKYGIDHGVMQSKHWRYRPHERIQVCSAQTIEKRGSFPGLNLLIIDEAHQTRSATVEFIKNNPSVKVVGLTATPFTKGLGSIYSNVVVTTTTEKLVKEKNLCPLRVFIAKEIDMSGAKKVAGEWSDAEATERGIKITGDVVAEWVRKTHEIFGGPRKTVVFCASVAHGADLAEKFAAAGYNFVPLSYKDTDEFKADAIKEFSKPDSSIHGLIATDILTKGFDVADTMIGISARPFSKSLSSHIQQLGRVMRASPGKEYALWLDHSGNFLRFADDWDEVYHNGPGALDDGKEKSKPEPTEHEKKEAKCPKCGHLWHGPEDMCPHCGFIRQRLNLVVAKPGEMAELESGYKAKDGTIISRQDFYSELLHVAKVKGYNNGWAAHRFSEKFGVYPRGLHTEPRPTSLHTANWLKSRVIAKARAMVA